MLRCRQTAQTCHAHTYPKSFAIFSCFYWSCLLSICQNSFCHAYSYAHKPPKICHAQSVRQFLFFSNLFTNIYRYYRKIMKFHFIFVHKQQRKMRNDLKIKTSLHRINYHEQFCKILTGIYKNNLSVCGQRLEGIRHAYKLTK